MSPLSKFDGTVVLAGPFHGYALDQSERGVTQCLYFRRLPHRIPAPEHSHWGLLEARHQRLAFVSACARHSRSAAWASRAASVGVSVPTVALSASMAATVASWALSSSNSRVL